MFCILRHAVLATWTSLQRFSAAGRDSTRFLPDRPEFRPSRATPALASASVALASLQHLSYPLFSSDDLARVLTPHLVLSGLFADRLYGAACASDGAALYGYTRGP